MKNIATEKQKAAVLTAARNIEIILDKLEQTQRLTISSLAIANTNGNADAQTARFLRIEWSRAHSWLDPVDRQK